MRNRAPSPTPTLFAFDVMLDGQAVAGSDYVHKTEREAEWAAIQAVYGWFDQHGPPEVPNLYPYITSKERTAGDEPVVERGMYDIGVPWLVRDNGGRTLDRYTVFLTNDKVLGLSPDPDSPRGVSQSQSNGFAGMDPTNERLDVSVGPVVPWGSLPEAVRKHVRERMNKDVAGRRPAAPKGPEDPGYCSEMGRSRGTGTGMQ